MSAEVKILIKNACEVVDILSTELNALKQRTNLEFEKLVNTRDYEENVITAIAKKCDASKELIEDLLIEVNNKIATDRDFAFSLFFVAFTICRRQNICDINDMALKYQNSFSMYEIMEHIRLMVVLERSSSPNDLYRAIKESSALIEKKSENCDFTQQPGVLNVYVALVCKYFESQLDERGTPENNEIMQKALGICGWIEKNSEASYPKFLLNHGRMLILLGQYDRGEDKIQKAICELPCSGDRVFKVNEYSQYLVKASIIRSYDLQDKKMQELDKIKANNYKSLAIMTTLLGFLIGAINIFATVSDAFTLTLLMVGYSGLILVLGGVALMGLSLNMKEKEVKPYVFNSVIIVIGIVIFLVALIFAINRIDFINELIKKQ